MIKSLSLLTLSAGVKVACDPPMSVRTQPGLTTTQVMPRGDHVHRSLRTAIGKRTARSIVGNRTHAAGKGDDELALAASDVVDESLGDPKRADGIDVQDSPPRVIINRAKHLPRLPMMPALLIRIRERDRAALFSIAARRPESTKLLTAARLVRKVAEVDHRIKVFRLVASEVDF